MYVNLRSWEIWVFAGAAVWVWTVLAGFPQNFLIGVSVYSVLLVPALVLFWYFREVPVAAVRVQVEKVLGRYRVQVRVLSVTKTERGRDVTITTHSEELLAIFVHPVTWLAIAPPGYYFLHGENELTIFEVGRMRGKQLPSTSLRQWVWMVRFWPEAVAVVPKEARVRLMLNG